MKAPRKPIHTVSTWLRRQPPKIKAFLAVVSGMTALVFLRLVVNDHDKLFVAAEAIHALGISVLIYKLMKERTCAGISPNSSSVLSFFLIVLSEFLFVFFGSLTSLLRCLYSELKRWIGLRPLMAGRFGASEDFLPRDRTHTRNCTFFFLIALFAVSSSIMSAKGTYLEGFRAVSVA